MEGSICAVGVDPNEVEIDPIDPRAIGRGSAFHLSEKQIGSPQAPVEIMVVGGGLEPSARGFSVRCSTN